MHDTMLSNVRYPKSSYGQKVWLYFLRESQSLKTLFLALERLFLKTSLTLYLRLDKVNLFHLLKEKSHPCNSIVQFQPTHPQPRWSIFAPEREEGPRGVPFLESPVNILGSKGPVAFWARRQILKFKPFE